MKKALTFLIVIFAVASFWYTTALRPVDSENTVRTVVGIESGSSVKQIAQQLAEKDLIRSASAFLLYMRFHEDAASLQAGEFVLQQSLSVPEVIEVLQNAQASEMIITIPEGYSVKDIDALLTEKGLIEEGEIIDCAQRCDFSSFEFLPEATGLAERGGKLEGYLYPDTYFVLTNEFVPKFFLERMLGTFRKRVIIGLADDLEASDYSLHEVITMASLIEKEAFTADERPVIAGILWKRIENGIGLYVDAANRYILEKKTEPLTAADLAEGSLYNTRLYQGLPPGPIGSPGLSSISAALQPQVSDYWYYLHGLDGEIWYAVTNEEHNANKVKYLR